MDEPDAAASPLDCSADTAAGGPVTDEKADGELLAIDGIPEPADRTDPVVEVRSSKAAGDEAADWRVWIVRSRVSE